MPVSVHKILVHWAAVVDALPLPLGMLSEWAQEARNKDIRPIVYTTPGRTCGSIQSPISSGTYLMVTGDDGNEVRPPPHLPTIRPPLKNPWRRPCLSPEVLRLLKVYKVYCDDDPDSSDSDS